MNEIKPKSPLPGEFPEKDRKLKAGSLSRFAPPRESPVTGGVGQRNLTVLSSREESWGLKSKKKGAAFFNTHEVCRLPFLSPIKKPSQEF
ncbi:hypothetical protein KFJ24_04130 [Marinobacter sediminum]|uniref:hypothetical protein n=1 Tax=Marinobacter sediminum TaxID=256323 RepID=UPI00202FBCF5|nr:hypothetical protein [Marinobacter sediminum]MCM0611661.1 hypothetical protein [Marinobacter sediminum]